MALTNSSVQSYALDEDGIPVMPDDLVKFANMNLTTRTVQGRKEIRALAESVYETWAANDYREVMVVPQDRMKMPSCWDTEDSEKQNFDGVFPETKDYEHYLSDDQELAEQADHQYRYDTAIAEIRLAKAKSVCSDCPLKTACLSASLTKPHKGRDGQINHNLLRWDIFGVWGGYGRGGRSKIFEALREVWGERGDNFGGGESDIEGEDEFDEDQLLAEISGELEEMDNDLVVAGIDLDVAS